MKSNPGRVLSAGFSLLELLLVIAIIGILIGLSLGGVQKARQASQRAACQNQLRQIGHALISHHDSKGAFPPGWQTTNRLGIAYTTWMVNILPFLGEEPLHRKIMAQPFKTRGEVNYFAISTPVKAFLCPDDILSHKPGVVPPYHGGIFEVAFTDYLGVSGVNRSAKDGVFFPDSQVKMADIKDGSSRTLLVGERPPSKDRIFGLWFTDYAYGDGNHNAFSGVREFNVGAADGLPALCPKNVPIDFQEPKSWDEPCSYLHFWSYHSGGANFLFADGSVQLIPYKSGPLLNSLATRDGGEISPDL